MLSLDDAIIHAEEVARENEEYCFQEGGQEGYFYEGAEWDIKKCAAEHRQLAEWLKDYKRLLGAIENIRAEINKLDDLNPDYPMDMTVHLSKWEVLQIIDKYTSEKEQE